MTTRREDLAARMDALVNHGRDARLESHEVGSNLRMSEVSAAIGRVQLKRLDDWLVRRRMIADRYTAAFEGTTRPHHPNGARRNAACMAPVLPAG